MDLHRRADQSDVFAQTKLGLMYFDEFGVSQNPGKAFELFCFAGNQGNPGAKCILAAMYLDGTFVPHDFVQAYYWCSLAAACISLPKPEPAKIAKRKCIGIAANLIPERNTEAGRLAKQRLSRNTNCEAAW